MSKPCRLYVSFTNHAYDLRVQAHKTDKKLLVVKSTSPDALDHLTTLTEKSPGVVKALKGSKHYVTFVNKDEFLSSLAVFMTQLVDKNGSGGSPEDEDDDEAASASPEAAEYEEEDEPEFGN